MFSPWLTFLNDGRFWLVASSCKEVSNPYESAMSIKCLPTGSIIIQKIDVLSISLISFLFFRFLPCCKYPILYLSCHICKYTKALDCCNWKQNNYWLLFPFVQMYYRQNKTRNIYLYNMANNSQLLQALTPGNKCK